MTDYSRMNRTQLPGVSRLLPGDILTHGQVCRYGCFDLQACGLSAELIEASNGKPARKYTLRDCDTGGVNLRPEYGHLRNVAENRRVAV